MRHLDEFYFIRGSIQRAEDSVNAVAGITKNSGYSPPNQPLDQEIATSLPHKRLAKRKPCHTIAWAQTL